MNWMFPDSEQQIEGFNLDEAEKASLLDQARREENILVITDGAEGEDKSDDSDAEVEFAPLPPVTVIPHGNREDVLHALNSLFRLIVGDEAYSLMGGIKHAQFVFGNEGIGVRLNYAEEVVSVNIVASGVYM